MCTPVYDSIPGKSDKRFFAQPDVNMQGPVTIVPRLGPRKKNSEYRLADTTGSF